MIEKLPIKKIAVGAALISAVGGVAMARNHEEVRHSVPVVSTPSEAPSAEPTSTEWQPGPAPSAEGTADPDVSHRTGSDGVPEQIIPPTVG